MKHKLTQQDVDKMKAEIEHRKVEVRPELLEHVKEARAHGDLSENFEYHAAKKEKNRNECRPGRLKQNGNSLLRRRRRNR